MADFVAVIRRAVDGLSDNTPEMRVKVYEKARSAVLRQLESMKPRPPEEMLRRQLDKLEAAILEVEAEHAEALPAAEEPDALDIAPLPNGAGPAGDAEPVTETYPVQAAEAAPVEPVELQPLAEPAAEEPAWQDAAAATPADENDASANEPVGAEAYREAEPVHQPEPQPRPIEAVPAWEEPARPVQPAPAPSAGPERYAPAVAGASPTLFGDETWAGEEEAAPKPVAPAPVQAPSAYDEPEPAAAAPVEDAPFHTYDEPEDYRDEPVHQPAFQPDHAVEPALPAAPEADPWQGMNDEAVPEDFPVEEPTSHYSQPAPAPVEDDESARDLWPHDGVQAVATGTVQPEEWTATAVYRAPADEDHGTSTPDLLAAYQTDATAAEPVEPLAWDPSQTALDVDSEPAEFVEVASVQGELAAAAQDRFDEPVLHGETRYQPAADDLYEEVAAPAAEPVYEADSRERDDQFHAGPAPAAVPQPELVPVREDAVEWDDSPFTDVSLPVDEPKAGGAKQPENDQWDEFQEFNSYGRDGNGDDLLADDFVPVASDKPARSYRVQSRRRIDFTSIGLGLLGLALVAGSGYGAWTFRDTLSGLVTGLVSTPPAETTKTPTTDTAAKPATPTTDTDTATTTEPTKPATPTPTDMANAEPEIQKFTQRLRADGSEVDEGTADGASPDGEGRSLAPQTVASSEPVDTTTQPAGSTGTGTPAAIPVGVSQKMYLYEERVGQTSPAAVEGAVVWSLKHEKAENGKDEAIVQAQVSAPDRGLSALVSFKRNLDPSLPASHLVELVFSLPKEFEGGAIESVQRVAMKQTEQDRGDPLIAVPAKITDDFHMIALNDYADAREFNLRLLQTRNWIDIPVTYRNGRRALITMEKGSTGTEAFNQAIREWRALDPTPAPAQPAAPAPAPAPAANAEQAPASNPQ